MLSMFKLFGCKMKTCQSLVYLSSTDLVIQTIKKSTGPQKMIFRLLESLNTQKQVTMVILHNGSIAMVTYGLELIERQIEMSNDAIKVVRTIISHRQLFKSRG